MNECMNDDLFAKQIHSREIIKQYGMNVQTSVTQKQTSKSAHKHKIHNETLNTLKSRFTVK